MALLNQTQEMFKRSNVGYHALIFYLCPQRVQKGVLSALFASGHITDWRVCSSISAMTVASLASLHALYVPTEPSATMLCTNTFGPNTLLLLLTNKHFGHQLFHLFKNPVYIILPVHAWCVCFPLLQQSTVCNKYNLHFFIKRLFKHIADSINL